VAEILVFLCHWSQPQGHNLVLRSLDNLKNVKNENGRFDAWLKVFENAIDGRGKMGSLVGASEEVRSLRGRGSGVSVSAWSTGSGGISNGGGGGGSAGNTGSGHLTGGREVGSIAGDKVLEGSLNEYAVSLVFGILEVGWKGIMRL
jgi:hypothetical protein